MRVLQLTSYPTIDPRHGGQIRSSQIASELRKAGHVVKSVAVYVEQDYPVAAGDDIPFRVSSAYWKAESPWLSDYFSGLYAENDAEALTSLVVVAKQFDPDIIMVEQPWLFRAAKKLVSQGVKLIYSSQNVEWRLKDKILERHGHAHRSEVAAAIREIEIEAAREADVVVACTAPDLSHYAENVNNATRFNGVVAGNGVEPFSCTDRRVSQWRRFFKNPMAVFVSSAHLPNARGFWDMMSPGLSFLRPGEQILVLGGVSSIILQTSGFERYSELNLARLNVAGSREKEDLQSLVRASHVVLLPITEGEGSNLKTAEALESGCAIIGTSKAFRGFESAMSLPHVQIADNARDFRKAVRQSLDRPRYTEGTPFEVRSKFYWEKQLRPLIESIETLSVRVKGRESAYS